MLYYNLQNNKVNTLSLRYKHALIFVISQNMNNRIANVQVASNQYCTFIVM